MPVGTLIKSLAKAETDAIRKTATKGKTTDEGLVQTVTDEAARIKNAYPTGDGWAPITVNPKAQRRPSRSKRTALSKSNGCSPAIRSICRPTM